MWKSSRRSWSRDFGPYYAIIADLSFTCTSRGPRKQVWPATKFGPQYRAEVCISRACKERSRDRLSSPYRDVWLCASRAKFF
jgi:hypothetical protein